MWLIHPEKIVLESNRRNHGRIIKNILGRGRVGCWTLTVCSVLVQFGLRKYFLPSTNRKFKSKRIYIIVVVLVEDVVPRIAIYQEP